MTPAEQAAMDALTCQDNGDEVFVSDGSNHLHECNRLPDHRSRRHRCACGVEWWANADSAAPSGGYALRVHAATALRSYADREHALGGGGGHGPISLPGGWLDADSFCQCGASEGEDGRYRGCSERVALLRYADAIEDGSTRQEDVNV